jgi:hypothetical protein
MAPGVNIFRNFKISISPYVYNYGVFVSPPLLIPKKDENLDDSVRV